MTDQSFREQYEKPVWVDEVHGIRAQCNSRMTAWGLIRNECHRLGLTVPTLGKIKMVNENKIGKSKK